MKRALILTAALFSLVCGLAPQTREGRAQAEPVTTLVVGGITLGVGLLVETDLLNAFLGDREILEIDHGATKLVQYGYGPLKGQYAVYDGPNKAHVFEKLRDAELFMIETFGCRRMPSSQARAK
jgi:hypothetical protein